MRLQAFRRLTGCIERNANLVVRLIAFVQRIVRYTAVGAICATLHNVVMISADMFGANYVVATLLSFSIVNPLGYLFHSGYTFSAPPTLGGLLRFISGGAIGLLLSLATMAILCSGLGWRVMIAAPITTAVLFIWNYGSAHWAVIGLWWPTPRRRGAREDFSVNRL
jgi:putative flippase GtrA